jgi:hypothetical protein
MDIQIENGGTIFLFRALSDAGRKWLYENTQAEPWQWIGDASGEALVVEHRYAGDLAANIVAAGLEIQ